MLYGEIQVGYCEDGSLKLDASHCTADGGSAEIQKALVDMAKEVGGEWQLEKHTIRQMHHHSHDVDHHQHH